jgi:tRNA(fMet)-specific endonuclease VapC
MEVICLDTNILIAHKRAKLKETTTLFKLSRQYSLAVTTITAYELFRGDNRNEDIFWSDFFSQIIVLDFTISAAMIAGGIFQNLKSRGQMIEIEDILIASIAISNDIAVATENTNHFSRIQGLKLIQ